MHKNSPLFVDLGQGLSMMVGLPAIASWDTHDRPKKAKRGMLGFNSQTNSLEYYNGSSWYEAHMNKGWEYIYLLLFAFFDYIVDVIMVILDFFKNISPTEIAIIVLIFVVIFGRKFMVGLGKASGETYKEIKNIKKNITEVTGDSGAQKNKEVSN